VHLRNQWLGMLALFLVLTGGTAYALDGSNTVFSDDIVNGEVRTADLNSPSVTTDKLADGAVTSPKIAQGAVTSDDILNGGIAAGDIALDAVGTFQIRDGGVEGSDIAQNAVTGEEIADGTVTGADIDESSVSGLDRCPPDTKSFRRLCVHLAEVTRSWVGSSDYCTSRGWRLAAVSELRGIVIARSFPAAAAFWADDLGEVVSGDHQTAYDVRGNGAVENSFWSARLQPLCVTGPLN